MKLCDQLIYITDFGYELCTFVEEGKRGQFIVHIDSGTFLGRELSLPEVDIKPYSKTLIKELQRTFKNGPEFSDKF